MKRSRTLLASRARAAALITLNDTDLCRQGTRAVEFEAAHRADLTPHTDTGQTWITWLDGQSRFGH